MFTHIQKYIISEKLLNTHRIIKKHFKESGYSSPHLKWYTYIFCKGMLYQILKDELVCLSFSKYIGTAFPKTKPTASLSNKP